MSLVEIWRESREQLEKKQLRQVIAFAGEGKLLDGSVAAQEFREFLKHIPSQLLLEYADQCLVDRFADNGLALQDAVNELGARLGFKATAGRYRGAAGEIGNDGLWEAPDGHALVVEVKTTDAYRIDLNTISGYRRALIAAGQVDADRSSMLVVVGRQDTGDLEAQIRGSKHAWDLRLISVDALGHLLHVKEDVEEPGTAEKIRSVLVPHEYTRLDDIIDLIFTTTADVQQDVEEEVGEANADLAPEPGRKFKPVSFNDACVERIARGLKLDLIKKSRTTFSTADAATVLVCAVSRQYGSDESSRYWFGFPRYQQQQLEEAESAYVAFGCGSPDQLLVFPYADFFVHLDDFSQSEPMNRPAYWHVHIQHSGGRFELLRRAGKSAVEVTKYLLPA